MDAIIQCFLNNCTNICSVLEEFKQFIHKIDLKSHSLKGPRRVPI